MHALTLNYPFWFCLLGFGFLPDKMTEKEEVNNFCILVVIAGCEISDTGCFHDGYEAVNGQGTMPLAVDVIASLTP